MTTVTTITIITLTISIINTHTTTTGTIPELTWNSLSRGAGSQFIMSIPHGALNFAVTGKYGVE